MKLKPYDLFKHPPSFKTAVDRLYAMRMGVANESISTVNIDSR